MASQRELNWEVSGALDASQAIERERLKAFEQHQRSRTEDRIAPLSDCDDVLADIAAANPRPTKQRPEQISTYQTYYYSGGQAQVYLEDVFLDEVTNLYFTTVTNKAPIYGYASERFDTVAKGNMIVQGSFSINFVSTNYLQIISQIVREGNGDARLDGTVDGAILSRNADLFLEEYDRSEFKLQQTINQIRGYGNKEFKELAIQMQQRRKSKRGLVNAQFYELPPFDIYAIFGDHLDESANHTVRRIKDVYLTGSNQVVSPTGEPIQEQYSFIARDIG